MLGFRQATFGRYGLTSLIALGLLLATGRGMPLGAVDAGQWAVILTIGLTTGSGAIFLYYYGLTRVRAVVSAICELCLPLSAVVFDYWLNGSLLGGWQWLGAILLLWPPSPWCRWAAAAARRGRSRRRALEVAGAGARLDSERIGSRPARGNARRGCGVYPGDDG